MNDKEKKLFERTIENIRKSLDNIDFWIIEGDYYIIQRLPYILKYNKNKDLLDLHLVGQPSIALSDEVINDLKKPIIEHIRRVKSDPA